MLDGFIDNSEDPTIFLASYLAPTDEQPDYSGDVWVGTSHESTEAGIVRHSPSWIEAQCSKRGLRVDFLPGKAFDGQNWLRVQRKTVKRFPNGQAD